MGNDTITLPRATVQAALDILDAIELIEGPMYVSTCRELRTALAQPAPQQLPQGFSVVEVNGSAVKAWPMTAAQIEAVGLAGEAQPAGEPVAWVVSVVVIKETPTGFNTQNKLYPVNASNQNEAHGMVLEMLTADFPEHRLHTICSYATPQPRTPLSDELIRSMCKETWVFETVKQWVRAIEAAHGITGGQA